MQGQAVNTLLTVQAALGNGVKSAAGVGPWGPKGHPLQFPPDVHADAPPPQVAYQNPPELGAEDPPLHIRQNVYPGAGPPGLNEGPGPMTGPPGQGFRVDAGEDLNYPGGLRNVGAMPHGALPGGRGRSVGSAEQHQSSLNASTATITNITKMSWTDFQRYAFVLLFLGSPSFAQVCNAAVLPVVRINDMCCQCSALRVVCMRM